jgi:hypothetical protein
MKPTAENLITLHTLVRETVQLWADRLITDMEFVAHMGDIYMAMDGADPSGLLDPNTGLRYPTK